MRNSGGGLSDPVATEVDAAELLDKPTLREHTVQLTAALTGKPIRFQLVAHTAEGSSISQVAQYILAAAPSKPSSLVTFRYAETPYLTLT
jgi:hypothetical protein